MPVSGQFYGFDILSGDLDLGPRSQLHFPSNAENVIFIGFHKNQRYHGNHSIFLYRQCYQYYNS